MLRLLRGFLPSPWIILAIVLAFGLSNGWSYMKGRSHGREAVLAKLKDDRITIFEDGRKIDEEVIGADEAGLCEMLGGCS